jgi:hypothetical protein
VTEIDGELHRIDAEFSAGLNAYLTRLTV